MTAFTETYDPCVIEDVSSETEGGRAPSGSPVEHKDAVFNDALVLELRRAVRAGTTTREDIQKLYPSARGCVLRMLNGTTYRHVGEALTKAELTPPPALSDQEVVEYRNAVRKDRIRFAQIARERKMTVRAVSRMIRGLTYDHVPGALSAEELAVAARMDAMLTDEQVLSWRRAYLAGLVTHNQIHVATGMSVSAVSTMLTGKRYKHVPEAVPNKLGLSFCRRFTDEQVLFMRLQYAVMDISVAALARAYGCDHHTTVGEALCGTTYEHVPCAIAVRRTTRRLTENEVIACRRAVRTKRKTIPQLAAKYDIDREAMRQAVRGITYREVPGAVVPEAFAVGLDGKRPNAGAEYRKIRMRDEAVLDMRRAYVRAKGTLTCRTLGEFVGASRNWVREVLIGKRFSHVPEAVVMRTVGWRRKFTPEQVIAMRAKYPEPGVSLITLAAEYGTVVKTVEEILVGKRYKEVPGALDKLKPTHSLEQSRAAATARRRFTQEQVLFMRLSFRPRVVTAQKIADAFGVNKDSIRKALSGRSYADVPEAIGKPQHSRATKDAGELPEATVIWARDIHGRRLRSPEQIAEHLNVSLRSCEKMLDGRLFAHLPGAAPILPQHDSRLTNAARSKKAGKALAQSARSQPPARPRLIKVRPPRLLDHDERVDLVALRTSAA